MSNRLYCFSRAEKRVLPDGSVALYRRPEPSYGYLHAETATAALVGLGYAVGAVEGQDGYAYVEDADGTVYAEEAAKGF